VRKRPVDADQPLLRVPLRGLDEIRRLRAELAELEERGSTLGSGLGE
jgi:hypothetical protein